MSMEGTPKPSDVLDKDFVSEKKPEIELKDVLSPEEMQAEVVEAMKAGNFEVVREWYAEQERVAEQDPSIQGHLELTLLMAKLQLDSGVIDEETGENYAFETLDAAYTDAYQQGNDESARRIQAMISQLRGNI